MTQVSPPKVSPGDIEALIEIFDGSSWDELELKLEGVDIYLSKRPGARAKQVTLAAPAAATAAPVVPAAAPQLAAGTEVPAGLVAIRAPNLGTFYRAPKPGAASYVELGQKVTPDTEICLIEVMKLFTPARAGLHGTIRKVCVEDGQLVEFDQTLFLVEPHA